MRQAIRRFLIQCAVILGAQLGGTQAAVLHVTDGILTGASDVLVNGIFYEVEFVDGTCISLFPSSYGAPDCAPPFLSKRVQARQAARALIDQVFLDGPKGPFDTSPALTRGCSDPDVCNVLILDDVYCEEGECGVIGPHSANTREAIDIPELDYWGYIRSWIDTSTRPDVTYATWTPTGIAEPTPLALLVITALAWPLVLLRIKHRQAHGLSPFVLESATSALRDNSTSSDRGAA